MTEGPFIKRNGSSVVWRLGISTAVLITLATMIFYAGGFAQDVETLQGLSQENKQRSLNMGLEVNELKEAEAAASVMGRVTARRLLKIEQTLEENRASLLRIEGLLGGFNTNERRR